MKDISRRQLLKTLGIATVMSPVAAFAQGRCGGARAGTPECNTIPFKPPFESTGWKTVALDHFSVQVADLEKEAAFFNALMGWKVRSNDGKTIVMDIGNLGESPDLVRREQVPLGIGRVGREIETEARVRGLVPETLVNLWLA